LSLSLSHGDNPQMTLFRGRYLYSLIVVDCFDHNLRKLFFSFSDWIEKILKDFIQDKT